MPALSSLSSCLLASKGSSFQGDSRYKHGDQRGWLHGLLSSSPEWDWGGRLKVGAFTAELGTWRKLPPAEEVCDACTDNDRKTSSRSS